MEDLAKILSRYFDRWCVIEDLVHNELLIYTPNSPALPGMAYLITQRLCGPLVVMHRLPWWRCRFSKKICMTKENIFKWKMTKF